MSRNVKRADQLLKARSSITSTLPGGPHPSKASPSSPQALWSRPVVCRSERSEFLCTTLIVWCCHPTSLILISLIILIPSQCFNSSLLSASHLFPASATTHPPPVWQFIPARPRPSQALSCRSGSRSSSYQDHLWTLTERLLVFRACIHLLVLSSPSHPSGSRIV